MPIIQLTTQFLARLLLLALPFLNGIAYGQLDSIHWIPPITAADFGSSAGAYQHSVYLSTPETSSFDVTVTTGTGTLIGTYTISNATPQRIDLANQTNYLCLESDSVGSVQQENGLIFSGDYNFYVNYRIRSNAQGGSLTAKGRIARGQEFYWGGVPNYGNTNKMNGVLGIMAIEDGTTVTIDGYDTGCEFRQGATNNGITANSITINLDAGETYVLECINTVAAANDDGWIGAHVTSDKDIVMNNGNLMAGVISASGSRDICIDQTLPVTRLGNDHITLEGNGTNDTELVVVVGTVDGTDISVNGAAPVTTINKGQYYVITGSNYTAQGNMFIETSEPAYVYQVLAGSSNVRTIGLNFIPPLNCLLPLAVDNISDIDMIRSTSYSGAVTILTRTGATVLINGSAPSSSAQVVTGNSDWVTYMETGLSGNVSISSDEPMAAGMFGASGDAGFAGYFSGFSEKPTPEISKGADCVPSILTLENTVDNIQWHFDGSPISGETGQNHTAATEGSYFTVAGTGTCKDTSNIITINCNSLPVDFAWFEAGCEGEDLHLTWRTISELDNDYFTIEYSTDGVEFEMYRTTKGQGTTSEVTDYLMVVPKNEISRYYRLIQTDYSGRIEELATISALNCEVPGGVYVHDGHLRINPGKFQELYVYDSFGRLEFESNESKSIVNIQRLKSGIYTVVFTNSNNITQIQRVLIP